MLGSENPLYVHPAEQLNAAGVAGMSPYYEAALPSANSVASIIPALTAYATAAMPHLGSLPIPLGLPSASLAHATRQVTAGRLELQPCYMLVISIEPRKLLVCTGDALAWLNLGTALTRIAQEPGRETGSSKRSDAESEPLPSGDGGGTRRAALG